jgi:LmbE family N-acetylglucosaminyl deacetylase
MNRILILSPHTDDAELGCGGSISKFLDEGNKILWLVFSTADESLPDNVPKDTLKKEFLNVAKSLRLKAVDYNIYNYKVRNLFRSRQEILEELIKIRNSYNPDLVIGPSLNDFHQDHHVIAQEMVRAFKTSSSIICYELPWNHITFNTQLFITLEKKHINDKLKLLNYYKSQISKKRGYFSPEMIKGLAATRGIQVGNRYAEAFEVIRWLI